MRYLDVRNDAAARPPGYPDLVAEVVSCGFATTAHAFLEIPEEPEHYARAYAEPDHQWFLDRWDVPATVLLDSEATTLVDISEFHGGPSVRFRSVLADGTLVETVRHWDRLPALNPELLPWGHQEDAAAQQSRGHHPGRGRSVCVVPGSESMRGIWNRHRDHLAEMKKRRHAEPVPLQGFDRYVAICEAAMDQEQRLAWIRHRISVGLMLVYLALGAAMAFEVAGRFGNVAGAGLALVAAVYAGAGLARNSQWLAIRLARSFPPRFRLSLSDLPDWPDSPGS